MYFWPNIEKVQCLCIKSDSFLPKARRRIFVICTCYYKHVNICSNTINNLYFLQRLLFLTPIVLPLRWERMASLPSDNFWGFLSPWESWVNVTNLLKRNVPNSPWLYLTQMPVFNIFPTHFSVLQGENGYKMFINSPEYIDAVVPLKLSICFIFQLQNPIQLVPIFLSKKSIERLRRLKYTKKSDLSV